LANYAPLIILVSDVRLLRHTTDIFLLNHKVDSLNWKSKTLCFWSIISIGWGLKVLCFV